MNLDFYDWYNIVRYADMFRFFKRAKRKRNIPSLLKPKNYIRKKERQHIRSNC